MVNPIRFVARMQPFDKLRTGFAESGGSGSIPDCTAFHPGYLFGSGLSGLGRYCAMQL